MEKIYYEQKPTLFETVRTTGVMITIIRLNIEQCTDEEHAGQWQCEEVCYPHKTAISPADYGLIISAIVRAKYSADDVEAIQQNYMESKTTSHKSDFQDLKAWRKTAKDIATELTKAES